MKLRVRPEDNSVFPGAKCILLPPDEPAAPSAYSEGTYILAMSGPGVNRVTDEEILRGLVVSGALSSADHAKCFLLHPEDSFARLLMLQSGYTNTSPQLDGSHLTVKAMSATEGKRDVHIRVSDSRNPSYCFTVSWVPTTVTKDKIEQIVQTFCSPHRVSQDPKRLMTWYVETTTKVDNIPHWLHLSNLVATDAAMRALKVSVRGRREQCQYCANTEHPHYKCPNKATVIKQRKTIHQQHMNKPKQQQPPPQPPQQKPKQQLNKQQQQQQPQQNQTPNKQTEQQPQLREKDLTKALSPPSQVQTAIQQSVHELLPPPNKKTKVTISEPNAILEGRAEESSSGDTTSLPPEPEITDALTTIQEMLQNTDPTPEFTIAFETELSTIFSKLTHEELKLHLKNYGQSKAEFRQYLEVKQSILMYAPREEALKLQKKIDKCKHSLSIINIVIKQLRKCITIA